VTTTHAHTLAATPPDEDWDAFIARRKHQPVTFGSLGAAIDTLFDLLVTMKKNRDQQMTVFDARIAAVEVDRAKSVGHVRWRGTFKHGDWFQSGQLVTHKGSLWVCQRETGQTPGRPPDGDASDWTLVVKSGEAR
jgi:hypothetical protein